MNYLERLKTQHLIKSTAPLLILIGISALLSAVLLSSLHWGTSRLLLEDKRPIAYEQRSAAPYSQEISGTLLLTKTVSINRDICGTENETYVTSGTDIYYCYQVQNRTDTVLELHVLRDPQLSQQIIFSHPLAPGQITTTIQGPVNVTGIISGTNGTAAWDAADQNNTVTAEASATVLISEPGLRISAFLEQKEASTPANRCGISADLGIPSGADVQHCIVIDNTGNRPFVTITVDAPALGLNSVTLPNRQIQPDTQYELTLAQASILGNELAIPTIDFLQNNVTVAQTTVVTVTAQTAESAIVTERATSQLSIAQLSVSALLTPKVNSTNRNVCGPDSEVTIPSGMNVQHCFVIENLTNQTLSNVIIDAPVLGINNIPILPNPPIAPGGRYTLTANVADILNNTSAQKINDLVQTNITASQTALVTVRGQSGGFAVEDTASSVINISSESIAVDLDVRAGTRKGRCDDTAFRVTANTDVYFCFIATNTGSLNFTNVNISHSQAAFTATNGLTMVSAQVISDTFGSLQFTTATTDTVSFQGDVNIQGLGTMTFNASKARGVGIVPALKETLTPTLTPTPIPATAGPTATNTRRPAPSTSTPWPSYTPTVTYTPSPRPMPPTNTVVSPLPTPTSTPTPVILRSVPSPTSAPTEIPTQTPIPTPTNTPTPTATPIPTDTPVPAETPTLSSAQVTQTGEAQNRQIAANTDTASLGQTSPLATPSATATLNETARSTDTVGLTNTAGVTETSIITDMDFTSDSDNSTEGTPVDNGPSAIDTSDNTESDNTVPDSDMTDNAENDTHIAPNTSTQVTQPDAQNQGVVVAVQQPPSQSVLIFARVIDSALAAAAWIWFLCGSAIFFGVAGLIAGLYFRNQESGRFSLIKEPYSEVGSSLGGHAPIAQDDASPEKVTSRNFQLQDGSGNPARDPDHLSPTKEEDDHWPTSLP